MGNGNSKFERFGRYLILDHLVDGGMAKICRARFLGEQADKIVAIKMVQPQFSNDESFKTMFMDEIKLTFGLLHPNIVQTYDYGMHNGQLYVAMEYCDGRNLKEYLDKLRERKFVFPVEISVYIITQVCQGLHYSHTFTDKLTGKKANIIHRDISPHNLMLTYDGAIKVIDFGIAKAETNSEATQAGTIKGKLSYLAPEYLDGLELDARYDEFAVGITLWEMLCSRKLFKASNDLAVLKKIQECKIPPPSSINPNVPKELDEIVLKALSKDRGKRFEDLDKLNRALIKFLYATYPDFNATDLSYFAKELFKEEIKRDREKLFEFGKVDLNPYLGELKREQAGQTKAKSPASPGAEGEAQASLSSEEEELQKKIENTFDFGFEEDQKTETKSSTRRKATGARSKAAKGGDLTLVVQQEDKTLQVQAASVSEVAAEEEEVPAKKSKSATTANRRVRKSSSTSAGTASGAGTGSSRVRRKKSSSRTRSGTKKVRVRKETKESGSKLPALVAMLLLVFGVAYSQFPDAMPVRISFLDSLLGHKSVDRIPANEKPKDQIFEEDPAQKKYGKVLVTGAKPSDTIFVNGMIKNVDGLGTIPVPVGEDVYIRVMRPEYAHFVKKLKLSSANDEARISVAFNKRAAFAFLVSGPSCPAGVLKFNLYGEPREEKVPLPRNRIWLPLELKESGEVAPIDYKMVFTRSDQGLQRQINVTVSREFEAVDLCELPL